MSENFNTILTLVLCLSVSFFVLLMVLRLALHRPEPVVIDETWTKPIQSHFTHEELEDVHAYHTNQE